MGMRTMFGQIGSFLGRMITMDIRSLALARVCLGIAILADLEQKNRFLSTFYSDEGILPRNAVATVFNQPYFYSLHMASGETWFQVILFLIAAILAILLIAGYKTRMVVVLSWFMLVSLQARNLVILNAGDGILRLLMFWAMFLPMGAAWSIDRALHTGAEPEKNVRSMGSLGWIIQVVAIYWVTVALRQSPEWLQEGSALYYALNLDQLTTSFGHWLSLQPLGLLQFLTWCAVFIEGGSPFFLLLPEKRGYARLFACLMGLSLHFGIFLMMHIGVFPFICMISWLGLLPGLFWDMLQKYVARRRTGADVTMYYDPNCNFCKKTVHLLRTFLSLQSTITPANENAQVHALMEKENSWVVVTPTGTFLRWDAMIQVFAASPLFFWLAPLMAWKPLHALGMGVYRWVASHRKTMGTFTKPLEFREQRWRSNWIGKAVVTLGVVLTILWNAQVLRIVTPLPAPVEAATLILRLDQFWNMFAPFPLKEDGWYVVPGQLVDGTIIDLLHNRDTEGVSYDKPADLATSFPTESWRKYFLNLWLSDYEKYREFYAEYHCRRWNTTHTGDKRLKQVNIYFMRETTKPPAQRGTETVEKLPLWEWHCGGV